MPTFGLSLQEVIDFSPEEERYSCIGLDQYPIFDEAWRKALNEKIIAHFNEEEIGHETDSMFKYAMRRKMNEIMPLYNQHYIASRIEFDPLKTVNIHNVATGTQNTGTTETNTTESTTDSKGRVVSSTTPQVRLSGNKDYASGAQDSVSSSSVNGTSGQTGSVDTSNSNDSHSTGYTGNPAEIILTLRQTFVNVDMMVIGELDELFMSVWDNGNEFTRTRPYPYLGYGIGPYGIY